MKMFICNAFSLNMLDRDAQRGTPSGYEPNLADDPADNCKKTAKLPRPIEDPQALLRVAIIDKWEIISAVGHEDIARLMSDILGQEIEKNRITVKLGTGSMALIGQYIGPRLPEGATKLPEGAAIEWWLI